jgi:ribosomal protein L12E/L44/L45/RPP1/RPP2
MHHAYFAQVQGPMFPSDEYMTDTYDDVVKSMTAIVGVEIGPVARLFHFHMLLDVRHLSKIAVDQRIFQEYFLGCWRGQLYDDELAIKSPSGHYWIPPNEQLHMYIQLQAEDEVAVSLEAYLKKDSINFVAAGLRAIAARDAAAQAAAKAAQAAAGTAAVTMEDQMEEEEEERSESLKFLCELSGGPIVHTKR